MKILLLLGSSHSNGTSATLAASFARGAEDNGHEIVKVECAKKNIHPCIGCDNCLRHGVCVWTDDMPAIENAVKECDAIIYVSPIYYGGITAQLKVVIDRFYSFNSDFLKKKPKLGLITAAHENGMKSTEPVVMMFEQMVRYVGAENIGMLNAIGVGCPEDLDNTDYVEEAYQFGKSL